MEGDSTGGDAFSSTNDETAKIIMTNEGEKGDTSSSNNDRDCEYHNNKMGRKGEEDIVRFVCYTQVNHP